MNDVLARARALFLAPEPAAGHPPVSARPARFAAVVAPPEHLACAAGTVATSLRRAGGARTVVVCRPGERFPPRPSMPAATALARRLVGREVLASAAGTLCRVALPTDPVVAVRDTWRLIGAVEVAVVLALPGRLDGYDDVLAQADHLYLSAQDDAPDVLTALALDSLARLGPPVTRVARPATILGRRRAALGLSALDLHLFCADGGPAPAAPNRAPEPTAATEWS